MTYTLKQPESFKIEKTVDDKIELIKSISEVQSKISDVVSSDFVLSKLDDREKQYVIEMSNNAFLSRRILTNIKIKATRWEWNKKLSEWIKRGLNKEEISQMNEYIQACFDAYMNRIYMIVLLNRNVPKNYLIEKMTGISDEPEDEQTRIDGITKKIKSQMGMKGDE